MSREAIHNYEMKLDQQCRQIRAARIPDENKELLFGFDRYLVAEGLSVARRTKLLQHALGFNLRYFPGLFRGASADAIWDAVVKLESGPLTPWTKQGYKVTVRKLFKFVEWGTDGLRRRDLPEKVAGIRITVKRRDQVRIRSADILTEHDMDQLLAAATDIQDKAFLTVTYELGARVSEVGTMRVGSVTRDEYGFICDLDGKTGLRSVRLVRGASVLVAWMNAHPHGDDRDAPMWGRLWKGRWRRIRYDEVRLLLKHLRQRSGLQKRIHPHLFRHSRITHVLASGQFNEAQAKVFFGLVQDSRVLSTYSHVVARDANEAALRAAGVAVKKEVQQSPVRPCGMCSQLNPGTGRFCENCGYPRSDEAVRSQQARVEQAGSLVDEFLARPEVQRLFLQHLRTQADRPAALVQLPQPAASPRPPEEDARPSAPRPGRPVPWRPS